DLSQDELALRAKLSGGYISQIETGSSRITLESMQSVADGLGICLLTFFDEAKWDHIPDRQILSEGILWRLAFEGAITESSRDFFMEWIRNTGRGFRTREEWLDVIQMFDEQGVPKPAVQPR